MKLALVVLLSLLGPSGLEAQGVLYTPDEATKIWALKRAYFLNGNSMVGSEMIDVSAEIPGARASQFEVLVPTVDPNVKNELDDAADVVKPVEKKKKKKKN